MNYLKKFLITIICSGSILYAQETSLYLGGIEDGSSSSKIIGNKLNGDIASLSVLYQGSNGDGFDSNTSQTILIGASINFLYNGGIADGHSKEFSSALLNGGNLANVYDGGKGDGNDVETIQAFLNGELLSAIFDGGFGDGHDAHVLADIVLKGMVLNLYAGGDGDGFSSALIVNNYLSGLMLMLFEGGDGDGHAVDLLTSSFTLDVMDKLIEDNIILFPNPASDIVNFKTPDDLKLTEIEIYDISGKKISVKLDGDNTLNIQNLSEGIYLVKIFSEDGSVTKKLIVKR